MIVITLVFGLIIAWYLYGFSEKRRINRRRNHYQAYGISTWVIGYVDGDRGFFPWVSMPYPIKAIESPERWNQFITDPRPEKNSVGNTITYSAKEIELNNVDNVIEVSDKTSFIRKTSRFIFRADTNLPISGLSFVLVLPTIFKIFNPMKRLPLGSNTLGYAQGEVGDAFDPWFTEKEIEWKREYDLLKDPDISFGVYVFQKMEKFRIDDLEKIIIKGGLNYREYLEEEKFRKYGFKFGELSLQLGYGKSVMDLLKSRADQQKISEEANNALKNEQLQKIKRKTQINDAKANATATEKEWRIQKEILKQTAGAQAKINSSWKQEVLVLGEGQGNTLVQSMTGGIIAGKTNNPKKGGDNEKE